MTTTTQQADQEQDEQYDESAQEAADRRKAVYQATKRVREAHADTYEKFLREECDALGIEYKRRRSGEERARAQIEKLLAEYPELAETLKSD
jgi:hypothetical protein